MRHRPRVSLVVAALLVTVTTLLFGALAATSYFKTKEREQQRLRRGLIAQTEELAEALALPVWNLDRAQIDKIIDSQAPTPQIYAMTVDTDGKIHARVRDSAGRFATSAGNVAVPQGMMVGERPIVFSGERLGTVRLIVTNQPIREQLRQELLSTALTTLGTDVLLVLSVYLALWLVVLRPLEKIERYALAVSTPGGTGSGTITMARRFTNEMESLRGSIENMVSLLETRYSDLQKEVFRRSESEDRFRTIFNSVNDAIIITDVDTGEIVDINSAMCEMFGYEREDALSVDIANLGSGVAPYTASDVMARISRAVEGERQMFDWHARHRDGHLIRTEISLQVAPISGRKRAIVAIRDITGRKAMEDALRAEKEFTDAAINTMMGPFFVQNRAGQYIRWNRATAALLGVPDEDIPKQDGLALIHPDDRDYLVGKTKEVFNIGYAEAESRIIVRGEVRHYLLNGRRMDMDDQQFLVGTSVDITERRRAEAEERRLQKEIERSALEWQRTFDTVNTPIFITERSGAIVRVNRAARDVTGLDDRAIAGTLIRDVGPEEPWQTASQLVAYVAEGRSGTSAEAKDKQGRTWELTITQFAIQDDEAERLILVLWDITGIVELQESLRKSETLSAMGTLVAGVAHEVRNPLFGISATLDAYRLELSHPDYVDCGATLQREVGRLVQLMQELLEYGKPQAMSIELASIHEVVQQAVENRELAARNAGVLIEDRTTGSTPSLLMDRSRLQQVFENLIDNAIQHSSSGGVVRITEAVIEHAGREWLQCCVEDSGTGFPEKQLDRVFEPFFTRREGGTGLGLSIVQRIVEEHSGKVTAANRKEGGGVVRVLLPLGQIATTRAS
jgi:PAS domain S-box-containing protein